MVTARRCCAEEGNLLCTGGFPRAVTVPLGEKKFVKTLEWFNRNYRERSIAASVKKRRRIELESAALRMRMKAFQNR